jgi:hypothetical protein
MQFSLAVGPPTPVGHGRGEGVAKKLCESTLDLCALLPPDQALVGERLQVVKRNRVH